jgi:hypothetical protein
LAPEYDTWQLSLLGFDTAKLPDYAECQMSVVGFAICKKSRLSKFQTIFSRQMPTLPNANSAKCQWPVQDLYQTQIGRQPTELTGMVKITALTAQIETVVSKKCENYLRSPKWFELGSVWMKSVSIVHLADQGHLESEGRMFATNILMYILEFSLGFSLRFKIYISIKNCA